VDRCLSKDRAERYASTKDLARDLAGLRDHISEASSGSGALAVTPARPRRRGALLAAAGLALAALAGVAGWFARARYAGSAGAPSFKRLSFQRGTLGNARFAPDGETVIYGWSIPGGGITLALTRLDSPESKPFEFPGDVVSISRTANLAIWLPGRTGAGTGTLEVVPMAGGTPRPLVENVAWAGADWDPGGKDLAIVREADGVFQLEFPIGRVLVRGDVAGPRFSPDGREIVFWDLDASGSRLVMIDRLGKQKTVLTSGWPPISGGLPCWSRQTDEIWFTASKPGETDSLWAVRRRDGKVRRVARVPGILELYDVSPDGRVLMAHHTMTWRMLGLPPGKNEEVDLSWLDQSFAAGLSADGLTVLITEAGEGAGASPALYLRTTTGAPAVRIGEGEGMALSPDKTWALARRTEKGRGRLWLVPTGPGETRPLPVGDLDVGETGAFTPDGKRVLFETATRVGSKPRVYIVDVAGGTPRAVTPEGIRLPPSSDPISPDGRWFFAGADSLSGYPLDGTDAPRSVPNVIPGRSRPVGWTADSRGIYVATYGRPLRVEIQDVETGSRRPWKTFSVDSPIVLSGLRVTPNGDAYVYTLRSATSELYLVEGLR
jgi:Tol biopolymer transport system component